jgi:hypothetical protein
MDGITEGAARQCPSDGGVLAWELRGDAGK